MARLPKRWPKLSLIFFRPSRSRSSTEKGRPVRSVRSVSFSRTSRSRRQAAKGSGEDVGQHHDGEQSAGNFSARVARTWQEALDEKRYKKQKSQHYAANPPGDGRPKEAQRRIGEKLEKENAGCRQDRAGKKKSGAENQ